MGCARAVQKIEVVSGPWAGVVWLSHCLRTNPEHYPQQQHGATPGMTPQKPSRKRDITELAIRFISTGGSPVESFFDGW